MQINFIMNLTKKLKLKQILQQTVKFKNQILVQCKKNRYCEDDFENLNLTNYKNIGNNTYVIKLDNTQDIFSFCQKLYDKQDIKSAHPNYIRKLIKR